MKYFYEREKIPEYPLTPAYSAGVGKIVAGERIIFLDSVYATERPVAKDKKIGSVGHFHPEEHIAYNIAGGRLFRMGDVWYDLKPGDVSVSWPYVLHEGNSANTYRVLNFKDIINGHSIYNYGLWEPGAEEFFEKIRAKIETGKALPCQDPWYTDIQEIPVYSWSKMKEYREAEYTPGMVKVIVGERLLLISGRYAADRGDGHTGSNPHCHPEEQITQIVSGKVRCRVADQWFTPEVGDLIYIPSGVEHEEIGDGPFETITLKNRIYGHNTYNDTWVEGARELFEEMNALYEESKQFPNNDPWFKDRAAQDA